MLGPGDPRKGAGAGRREGGWPSSGQEGLRRLPGHGPRPPQQPPPPRALSAAASRIAANCAPPRAARGRGRGGGSPAPRGNYRCSRRRPPGQRLRAAAEINWRRQRGPGRGRRAARSREERRFDRPRGRQLAAAAGAGGAGRRFREWRGRAALTALPSAGSCRSRPPCCRPRMPRTSPWAPTSGLPSWGCPRLCARPQVRRSRAFEALCRGIRACEAIGFACARPVPTSVSAGPTPAKAGGGAGGRPWTSRPPASWSVPFPPGFGLLPPAQAEVLARQQELLRKQNLAR